MEVTAIRSVDRIPVGAGKRGPITETLQNAFFGLFTGKTADKWGWLDHVDMAAAKRSRRGPANGVTEHSMSHAPQTMFEKVWDHHQVTAESADTPAVLFIDLHLIHEVTSPQAFSVLRARGLPVRRLDLTLATMDHSTPTRTEQVFGGAPISIESAAKQVRELRKELRGFRR